jgi:hypothetical protein
VLFAKMQMARGKVALVSRWRALASGGLRKSKAACAPSTCVGSRGAALGPARTRRLRKSQIGNRKSHGPWREWQGPLPKTSSIDLRR